MSTMELTLEDAGRHRRLSLYREVLHRCGAIHDVPVNGHTITYAEQGAGPAIVLLHGYNGSLFDWRRLFFPLAERGFRVVCPDMLGAGESSKPADADYSISAQAARITQLMDVLRIPKAVVVGNSYGGAVALTLARQRPERVDRLVLITPFCYPEKLPMIAKPFRMPEVPEWIAGMVPWDMVARLTLPFTDNLNPVDIEEYAREVSAEGRYLTIVKTLRAMLTEDPEEWEIRIRSTYTSTLVLWGSNDRTLPLDLGNRLARELPNAQFFVIEGAGHMPNQDRPQDVLKHITTFLQAA